MEAQYQLKDTKTFGGFDGFNNLGNPTMNLFKKLFGKIRCYKLTSSIFDNGVCNMEF
jgi:hypothetical protein